FCFSRDDCPTHVPHNENLLYYGTSCYYFMLSSSHDHHTAQRSCSAINGRLAVITDNATQTFLHTTMLYQYKHRGPVWIGLTNTGHRTEYVWDSGTNLGFSNWAPNQPADLDNGCVAMETNLDGQWMVFPCHMDPYADISYPFACEFPLSSACRQCGDIDNKIPCRDLDLVFAPFTACPEDKPYCMNDVYHTNGLTNIYERCASRDTCQREWFLQSSTKAQCDKYDHNVYADGLECHFCCYGDSCNRDLRPETSTLYTPDAPLKPSKCYKCGDLDQQFPCGDSNYTFTFDFGQQCQPYCDHLHIEVFENVPLACPDDSPYCMTDIFHRNGSKTTVYRRCVNEDTCRSEWYLQTSSKPECTTQFDPNINSDLECHLCCYGDGCNTGYVPPAQTLYTP
ncbi:hypothetical protein BaRGS_00030588, partial [Batillaria attramentaria]